jgi:hypothetical protein
MDVVAIIVMSKNISESKGNMMQEQKLLRIKSGEVNFNSKLISFLYELMRDHLPPGIVEKLVQDSQESDVYYANGWLAKYAENLASRLEDESGGDMVEYEEKIEKEKEEKEDRRRHLRQEERRMMQYDRD